MKYPLFTDMALTRDLPEHGLCRGDVVRLVEHHVAPYGREGYSIEVSSALGQTLLITAVDEVVLEPLGDDEVLAVRRLQSTA